MSDQPNIVPSSKLAMWLTSISLIGFVALIVVLILGWLPKIHPLALWGWIALAMILLLIGLGLGATDKWFGVIIEKDRNRASLSRLQVALWTVLIISAFLAMAFTRVLKPPKEMSAEKIEACKAEYVAVTYGIDITDLEAVDLQSDATVSSEQALAEATEECVYQPLKIIFPEELLLVLGISTASFAGSSIIKSNKRKKPSVQTNQLQSTVRAQQEALEEKTKEYTAAQNRKLFVQSDKDSKQNELVSLNNRSTSASEKSAAQERAAFADEYFRRAEADAEQALGEKMNAEQEFYKAQKELEKDMGILAVAEKAQLTDIFYGNQEGDKDFIDLGKVQNFFITIAILVSYGVAIGALLQDPKLVTASLGVAFPPMTSSTAVLLAISHAGYLTVQAPDRPATENPALS